MLCTYLIKSIRHLRGCSLHRSRQFFKFWIRTNMIIIETKMRFICMLVWSIKRVVVFFCFVRKWRNNTNHRPEGLRAQCALWYCQLFINSCRNQRIEKCHLLCLGNEWAKEKRDDFDQTGAQQYANVFVHYTSEVIPTVYVSSEEKWRRGLCALIVVIPRWVAYWHFFIEYRLRKSGQGSLCKIHDSHGACTELHIENFLITMCF